jgi:CRISPR/Cas system CSM-associated protein Csm3 (group 7 of RAMP superfamily)
MIFRYFIGKELYNRNKITKIHAYEDENYRMPLCGRFISGFDYNEIRLSSSIEINYHDFCKNCTNILADRRINWRRLVLEITKKEKRMEPEDIKNTVDITRTITEVKSYKHGIFTVEIIYKNGKFYGSKIYTYNNKKANITVLNKKDLRSLMTVFFEMWNEFDEEKS